MAGPPTDVDEIPDTPESRFQMALWDLLERAVEVSTAAGALSHLNEVRRCCEEAGAQARQSGVC